MTYSRIIATTAAALALTVGSASAATLTTPDALVLESSKNRADGSATGDIGTTDLGIISGAASRTTGIAGRIVSASDAFVFTSNAAFSMEFANLAFTSGTDIDGCEGFDPTDCSVGTQPNGSMRAAFSLDDGTSVFSQSFTSPEPAGTSIFTNVQPGTYTFTIDGDNGTNVGSAYDVLVTTQPVPLPAALWMLMGALGGLGVLRRARAV